MLGNIMVGTLYGWLYWQRGLFAAIIAHFSVDLMLHVFPAIKL
jgi:membrane protease YdiL (CAAX protease family)